jgi:hypothetical protein
MQLSINRNIPKMYSINIANFLKDSQYFWKKEITNIVLKLIAVA